MSMVSGLTVSIVLCFIPSIAFSFADPLPPNNVQSGLVSIIVALIGSGVVAALINSKVNTSIQKSKEESEHRLEEFRHKHEFEFEYDIALRTGRIEAYKGLWKLMLIFSFYAGSESLSCNELIMLLRQMSKWYYEEGGGIFLTEINQKLYQYMNIEIEKKIRDTAEVGFISKDDLEDLRKIASAFRTSLLQSIGTREEPKLPTTYDELKVELDGGEEIEGRGYAYCLGKDERTVIIKISLVGIETWEAICKYEVGVQIRKIKDNSKIDEGYAKIEYHKARPVWVYTWDIPYPLEEKERQKIRGGYLAIVIARILESQNQYSAVKMFDITQLTT